MVVEVEKTLNENKRVQTNVQLAIKHVILIAAINVHITSSIRGVARAFGVHHRNIMGALSRMMLMDTLQEILYYVTMQFATTCDYLSFVIMFFNFTTNNQFKKILTIFATMV